MRLSRRSSFLIIVVIASLLIGALVGFYFYTKSKNKPVPFLGQNSTGKTIGYNPTVNKTGVSTNQHQL